MKRTRAKFFIITCVASATLLAGCSSAEDEVRLAEPHVTFPATTTTSATPTTTEAEDEDDEETSTTTSTSTSTSTSSKSSSSSTSKSSSSSRSSTTRSQSEPSPEIVVEPAEPGAACAWPKQGSQSSSEEYSTFCDGSWARTVMPNGQEYFWASNGTSWKSVDPAGENEEGVCWDRAAFEQAPAAIRDAVPYCAAP